MKRYLLIALLLTGCPATPPSSPPAGEVPARAEGAPVEAPLPPIPVAVEPAEFSQDGLILSLSATTNPDDFLKSNALQAYQTLTLAGHPVVAVKANVSEKARLAKLPGVTRVDLDMKLYPHAGAPKDPLYPQQWAHQPAYANTETAWTKLTGVNQRKVIIADVDSGLEVEHEEFENRWVLRHNPTAYAKAHNTPEEFVADEFGHGTFTAGIAAAARDNTFGIAGVAYDALIMPVKVDHPEPRSPSDPRPQWGKFSLSDVIAGLAWLCDHNTDPTGAKVRVVNMSLGQNTLGVEPLYVEAASYARRKGILIVASTGNNGGDRIPPPANTPGVVAVGATSHYLNYEFLSPDSNYGPRLDLTAPGGGILSTVPFTYISELGHRTDGFDLRGYAYGSGTSEAAPFVSGVAALCFAKYDPDNASTATPEGAAKMVDKVRALLFRSVDDKGAPGWDPSFGWGRINVDKAMSATAPLPDGPAPTF